MGRSLKSLLLLISLITLVIFIIQNRQLITIVILNRPLTLALPLGIWVIIFMIAGFITSLLIKLLNPVEIIPVVDTYSSPSSKVSNKGNNYKNDEDLEEDDEWNIEEPPVEKTPIKDRFQKSSREEIFNQEEMEKQREKEFEFKENQTPQTSPLPDNNYEKKEASMPPKSSPPPRKSQRKKKDDVYDANYRIITPPYHQNPEESGTEDDFDF